MIGLNVSVGITAYNEEFNIGSLLDSLLHQKLDKVNITEIIVVSSGCTDRTEEIVKEFIARDNRIKLISQRTREGKASAINLFIKNATSQFCILESADTVPVSDTIEKLVLPFLNQKVGMTGAHPVPVNSKDKFIGFSVHLLWELHHRLALISPKLGEMICFRKVFDKIPQDSAVDEVSIEAIIKRAGYELCYVPDAIVYNKGPEKIKEFINQRRRIYTGHLWSKKFQNYSPSSMNPLRIIKLLFEKKGTVPSFFGDCPLFLIWTFFAVILEILSRFLGMYDFYIKHKNPFKWDIATTSKEIIK